MSNIRAGITSLKDPDDDYAYQILKGDVERIRVALEQQSLISGAPALPSILTGMKVIKLTVCVDGVTKTMTVLGTDPV